MYIGSCSRGNCGGGGATDDEFGRPHGVAGICPASSSPLEKNCAPSQGPTMNSGRLGHLPYDQLYELRKRHGYHRKDSKEVSETRLAWTQDQNAGSTTDLKENSEAPSTETGKRGRPPEDVAEHLQGPAIVRDKCRKRDALRAAVVAGKDVVTEQAQ